MFNIFCIFAICIMPKAIGEKQKVCQRDCRKHKTNKVNKYEHYYHRNSLSLPWWFGSL